VARHCMNCVDLQWRETRERNLGRQIAYRGEDGEESEGQSEPQLSWPGCSLSTGLAGACTGNEGALPLRY
jgi:hypothetical protein